MGVLERDSRGVNKSLLLGDDDEELLLPFAADVGAGLLWAGAAVGVDGRAGSIV